MVKRWTQAKSDRHTLNTDSKAKQTPSCANAHKRKCHGRNALHNRGAQLAHLALTNIAPNGCMQYTPPEERSSLQAITAADAAPALGSKAARTRAERRCSIAGAALSSPGRAGPDPGAAARARCGTARRAPGPPPPASPGSAAAGRRGCRARAGAPARPSRPDCRPAPLVSTAPHCMRASRWSAGLRVAQGRGPRRARRQRALRPARQAHAPVDKLLTGFQEHASASLSDARCRRAPRRCPARRPSLRAAPRSAARPPRSAPRAAPPASPQVARLCF